MTKKLRNALIAITAIQVGGWLAGQILARRMSRGDELSEEFRVAAICGGRHFQSRAVGLRSGSVVASMGGVDLDLRQATLDDDGAKLDINATMGGVQVTVPEKWAVEIEKSAVAGGIDTKVTAREDLPDDAPTLRVKAVVCLGGALVTTGADT